MSFEIDELIDLLKERNVYIQTHNFPDPDAIAAAFGLQVFLEGFGISSEICYYGDIEKTTTAAMVTILGIKMTEANKLIDMKDTDYIITVDSQKGNSNLYDLPGDEVVCIDHHPIFNPGYYRYVDIRMVGSCSSIIADYFRKHNAEMPEKVATALLYGLKTDTMNFTRGVTAFDIDIYAYLFGYADNALIRKLQTNAFRYDDLDAFLTSMSGMRIDNGVAYSFLDFDCTDAFVATVSDFMLGLDAVYFAVVFCRRGNGYKFSVRSEIEKLDAGLITASALSTVGNGGGHNSMAGGFAREDKLSCVDEDCEKAVRMLFGESIEIFSAS